LFWKNDEFLTATTSKTVKKIEEDTFEKLLKDIKNLKVEMSE